MNALTEFTAGWDCWVRWDHGYPEIPSRAFEAGYAAAAHENDHGGGERPQLAARDDTCARRWQDWADQDPEIEHARWALARAVLCVLHVAKGVTEGDFEYAKDCEESIGCYVKIAEQLALQLTRPATQPWRSATSIFRRS